MLKKLNTKSPILWGSVLVATLAVTGLSANFLGNNNSAEAKDNEIIATLTDPNIIKSTADTTDEMVYVITNKTGHADKILANSFTENKFNETTAVTKTDLPVTFDLSYKLDGAEISAADLAGKSGHVTITYSFANHQKYGNYQVPFATITTAVLSEDFSNVTVTNGRVLDDGTRKVVLGLTFPGLNNNFSTDLDLPETFEISADVTKFELGSTYTIATNQVFSDLNTSKLSTIDDLASAMDQLSSSMSQLIAGSTQLQDGLQQLLDKSGELVSGVNQLNDGLQTLSSKSGDLNSGAKQIFSALITTVNNELSAYADQLSNLGVTVNTLTINNYSSELTSLISTLQSDEFAATVQGTITQLTTAIQYYTAIGDTTTAAAYQAQLDTLKNLDLSSIISTLSSTKASLDQVNTFYTGLQQYTAGVDTAAQGSGQLASNLPALTSGITALRDGSTQLTAGLKLFNEQGINQLVAAGNKAESFANDLRATVSASQSYTHYSQPSAEQVTFIYKTPEI